MPSFDIVSEFDMHEAQNAIAQANKEVSARFDFKGSNAQFELKDDSILMQAQSTFQLQQMLPILFAKMGKRGIDVACLETGDVKEAAKTAEQPVSMKQGLDKPLAKKIVKLIKDTKLKAQAAIEGEKVRVTAKKRDDLQQVMQMLRGQELEMPLQFNNFRD
ncbi:MAG: cyclic-di-GMP-binding protein [Methyloprofundus sp.]|nr:MAG: cyclic-di-GMP-binding protein [Methyloprofundus sp.]